jgi:diacylglycerol kinase family enzyme
VTIESPKPLCIHIDGEFFCIPDDCLRSVEIEVVPQRLTVAYEPAGLYGGERFHPLRANQ